MIKAPDERPYLYEMSIDGVSTEEKQSLDAKQQKIFPISSK